MATQILLGVSHLFSTYWWLILGILLALGMLILFHQLIIRGSNYLEARRKA